MKKFKLWMIAIVALIMPTMVDAASLVPSDVEGVVTLTEDVELTASYVVESGKDITLNLNGKTITNTADFDTIYVEKGAKLTIEGTGKVINTSQNYATVFNNGTVIINGGEFNRGTVEGKYYILLNHGTMTINEATVSLIGKKASLVENGYYNFTSSNERLGYVDGVNTKEPTLTINGGTFDGGLNTIKNDDNGILTINDGTFTNNYQVSLQNWNVATINGGTFNTPTGDDKTNIHVGNYGADSVDKGILVINGGTFNAEYILEGEVVTPVEINGGEFNYTKGFINERDKDNLVDDNTEVTGGVFASDDVALVDGYTKYQVGEDQYVVVETISFDTKEESLALTKGEEHAINLPDVVKQYGVFASSDEKIAAINKNVITAVEEGTSKITVEFDGKTKVINLTVKKAAASQTTNPNTGDNVLMYLIIGIISVIGLAKISSKTKRFN